MRALGRIALVGVMAAATLGLTMGNATAVRSGCHPSNFDTGGLDCWIAHESDYREVDQVKFHAHGEILEMEDKASNGEGVGAWVEGTWYKHPKSAGEGAFRWDLSFAEGREITVQSCQTDGGTQYDCWMRYATA